MKLTGATVGTAASLGAVGSAAAGKYSWEEVSSPASSVIYDAVQTREGPYAVGASGDVFARRVDGWERVLDKGPTVKSNPLRSCDVTSDGRNLWFCGGSGVVGQYDVGAEEVTDYSAPKGKTSTWEAVAAAGQAGNDFVGLANGSGEFLPGRKNDQGGMNWGKVIKPGGGSSIKGIDFIDKKVGYVCDTTSKIYETTDGGKNWKTIGLSGSGSVALYGITAVSRDRIYATGGDGSIFRYNGAVWTKTDAGGTILYDIEFEDGEGLAAGGSGNLFEYRSRQGWSKEDVPVSATLQGVALDVTGKYPDIAVGSSGTIIERGFYTSRTPKDNELIIDGSRDSNERVEYRITVDGAIAKERSTEPDQENVSNEVQNGQVSGTATGATFGNVDVFKFSGSITEVAVTSGDPNEIYAVVNGDLIEVTNDTGSGSA